MTLGNTGGNGAIALLLAALTLLAATAGLLSGGPASAQSQGATRSLSATQAAPGETLEVSVSAAGYGPFGQVVEALPAGFRYLDSNLPEAMVSLEGRTLTFTLLGSGSFTYTVAAPESAGIYTFSGIVRDQARQQQPVAGASTVQVRPMAAATPTPAPTPRPPTPAPTPRPTAAPTVAPTLPPTSTPAPATAAPPASTPAAEPTPAMTPASERRITAPNLVIMDQAQQPTLTPDAPAAPALAAVRAPEPTAAPAPATDAAGTGPAAPPPSAAAGDGLPVGTIAVAVVVVAALVAAGLALMYLRPRRREDRYSQARRR